MVNIYVYVLHRYYTFFKWGRKRQFLPSELTFLTSLTLKSKGNKENWFSVLFFLSQLKTHFQPLRGLKQVSGMLSKLRFKGMRYIQHQSMPIIRDEHLPTLNWKEVDHPFHRNNKYLFNRYVLSTCYMPDSVLGAKDIAVNKTDIPFTELRF